MKRLVTSILIVSLPAFSGLAPTVAGAQPRGVLHDAVLSGDIGRIRLLISSGADVNAKDEAGFTPLFHAVDKGQKDIAAVLITGGANVNATDQYGNTPLHYAAVRGNYDMCQLLLAKGADPGAQNLTGGTPLAMAKAGGHAQVVQLLSSGAVTAGSAVRAGDIGASQSTTPKTDYIAELNKLGTTGRPESLNAAPYFQKAIELYVEGDATLVGKSWSRLGELSAQERASLQSWVQANSEALGQIEIGSQKPYCWFKCASETLQTDMQRLGPIKGLAKALQARALLRAEDADVTSTLNDLVTLNKLGALTAAGPKSLVEKLVGIAIKALATKAAFGIIDEKTPDVGALKTMQSQLEGLLAVDEPVPPNGGIDLRGEKLTTQNAVETQPVAQYLSGHVESAFARFDAIARKTPWELHNENIDLSQDENPLVKQVGPGIARAVEVGWRSRAETQALVATLAVLRYKAERGAYPATLEQAVSAGYLKELPADPYSGKPLVYRQVAGDFVLYSQGADFDDDGGALSKWGQGGQGGDQVFWPAEGQATANAQTTAQQVLMQPQYSNIRSAPMEQPAGTNSAATQMLHTAVFGGDVKQVESAIAGGADVNGHDNSSRQSWTALHAAAWYGHKPIAELLIAKGANVNAKDSEGHTPLHMAAIKGQSEIADLLIAKGADVNATDQTRRTPLYLAVEYGHKDLVELLIAKGADVNAQTGSDNALSLARKKQRNDIVELLVGHGAKEPVVTQTEGRLYAGEEGPALYPGSQQSAPTSGGLQTGAGIESTAQVNMANILADPNEIKARIETFEGLEKEIAQVDRRSRLEIEEWLQRRTDNRLKLAKAAELQIQAEISFIRKVAVEEKAEKTNAAIDDLLKHRRERFRALTEAMEDELQGRRPTRGTRGGSRGRSSGVRGRYPQDSRAGGGMYGGQAEGRAGYAGGGTASLGTGAGPTGYGGAREIPVSEWMQGPDSRTNLAQAVQEQVMAELTPIRKVAVEEQAKKTTAAIDGVLLGRQDRLDQLIIKMGGGPGGVPGRYPGAYSPAASTTEQEQSPPVPRRR